MRNNEKKGKKDCEFFSFKSCNENGTTLYLTPEDFVALMLPLKKDLNYAKIRLR